jgi:ribosomal-protein-alanine N-acetyltransferase
MVPTTLLTARLSLHAPDEAQVAAVADYYRRNQAHFAPWDPPLPADHAEPAAVRQQLTEGAAAFADGRSHRWWLAWQADVDAAGQPQRVIGSVSLSAIARGPFHSANLGYALDGACQGQGLMTEALQAVLAEAFGPRINLHRLQAGVRPENTRSLAVLARLGFENEGLARQYLFIDGAWRDHLLFAARNPAFKPPAHWPADGA